MLVNPGQSLKALAQCLPLALLEIDQCGNVNLWNAAAELMFGWTEEEVLGKSNPIISSEDEEEYKNDWLQLLAGSNISGKEARRRHKDGYLVEVKLWASPVHNQQHEITGVIAILEDITVEKENERQLCAYQAREEEMSAQIRRSEEGMRMALDTAKIGWWDWDLTTRKMNWTVTGNRQLGLPDDAPASFESFMDSVHPDDRENIREAIEAALHGETNEVSYRVSWPDGSLHSRSAISCVVCDETGKPTRMLGLSMDLDEQKFANDRLSLQAAALEAAANSILITDSQGTILWTNRAFSQTSGFAPAEVLGMNPRFLKSGLHNSLFYANMWEEIRSGRTWSGEITNRRKDGSLYTEETTITPVYIGGDQITNYIAIKHDVTERKLAEINLQRAEEKYRMLFEDAAIGIFQATPEGRPVSINRTLAAIHGYDSPEQLIAEVSNVGVQLFADPGAVQTLSGMLEKERNLRTAEFEIVSRDGTKKWIRANVRPLIGAGGKIVLHEGTVEDITERRKAESLLREKASLQEQLSNIIATVPGVVYSFLMRPDGSVAIPYASPRMFDILALSPESVTQDGSALFAKIHPDDRQRIQDSIAQSFDDLTLWHDEFRVNHPTRGEVWAEANSVPVRQPDGSVLWHGFTVDITARKHLEAQLRQAQRMESIGRLAGGIAHDFNNMMTVVIGYSDLIAETLPPLDPSKARVAKIKDAAYRASALTRQLLAFSRRQMLDPVAINLSTHISQLAEMLPRLLGEDIKLTLLLNPNVWMVHADPAQMDQVVMNLVINGRDAMPHGGELAIETANVTLTKTDTVLHPGLPAGDFVKICISDNGTGIRSEHISKIFEPFFTTKETGKGTGLGLSTAYGIVKQSGGFIGVNSALGVGTSFKIYLPRDGALSVGEEPKTDATPRILPPKTILLVEDEATLREVTAILLRNHGHSVLEAHDASEAISIVEKQGLPIDLLLTDVIMPGMNGVELADQLRRTIPSLKVLFVSGYADEILLAAGRLPAGAYFMHKPLTKTDLDQQLSRIFAVPSQK